MGLPGVSTIELTKLDWFIVPLWKGNEIANILKHHCMHDYEKPYGWDCLGIEEKHDKSDGCLIKFKIQLGGGPMCY